MLVKGVRCVIENPYSTAHYLTRYCPLKADYIIMDRSKYGDYFKKPTQFWFLNCEPITATERLGNIGKFRPIAATERQSPYIPRRL